MIIPDTTITYEEWLECMTNYYDADKHGDSAAFFGAAKYLSNSFNAFTVSPRGVYNEKTFNISTYRHTSLINAKCILDDEPNPKIFMSARYYPSRVYINQLTGNLVEDPSWWAIRYEIL